MDKTVQETKQTVNKQLTDCKISYDDFCFYMKEVVTQYNNLLKILSYVTGDIAINFLSMIGITKELLEKLCAAKSGWIDYYLYELHGGQNYDDGFVLDNEGNNIPLKTITDLWNLLNDKRFKYGNCNNIEGNN